MPGKEPKWLLINKEVLPDVFDQVLEAKGLLYSGRAKTTGEAARLAGISRSAFYKYKDHVFLYEEKKETVLNVRAQLYDSAGVLAGLLQVFQSMGANVLTLSQSIPVRGVAPISVSVETRGMRVSPEELMAEARKADGVLEIELLEIMRGPS